MSSNIERNQFFDTAWLKGGKIWENFTSLVNPPPSSNTLESCGYVLEHGALRSNVVAKVQKMLTQAGILVGRLRWIDVYSAGVTDTDKADSAYSNWFDVEHGIIVCNENLKPRDQSPGARLFPSEVLWQYLRAIVRMNISNWDTQDVIFAARTISTSTRDERTGEPPGYADTLRMLGDHKHELGHRLVDKVVVFGDKDLKFLEPEKRSMVIMLSHERPTPAPSPTVDGCPSKK
ncbi:hypothetical protein GMOD_00008675 [Pyrenophora seminiperda CCB06]|uniref:Uncharacterized protein n=1 Tax=Pyrenophora seminiperda CCB06 TaxID=1302712 RepID=A0A3M7M902_9PLEO|nr:hypothetical protein GMOD_00008675 [Pyrenophora seminiperda CCB06]